MQRITTILFSLCCLFVIGSLSAQVRYVDPMFEVSEPESGVYGANIDVYLQNVNQLAFDVYQPVDDPATELRPCVVMFPTGNFLVQYLNQGPYGSLRDSSVVEILNEVVSRGYVGFSAEYRTGWLPTATDQNIRTSTLLQAAYRGGQDAHTMARYLRRTVVEEGNPYQIDTNRIVFWGLGTGGYVTMTHAFLDNVDEVLADPRFYDNTDPNNPVPYVNIAVNADPQGLLPAFFDPATMTTPSNIPNHVGYSSEVAMSVNTGGALGDIDWMEGDDSPHQEPIVLGYHSYTDPFAPFYTGTVIVPTTGDVVITGVAGTARILERAQELGLNDAIAAANDLDLPSEFSDLSEAVNAVNAEYKTLTVGNPLNPASPLMFQLSQDDMYPFVYRSGDITMPTIIGAPYNWINPTDVTAEIAQFNMDNDEDVSAMAVIGGESLSNPNYLNPAGARTVIDTLMAHFIPRAYMGLSLDELPSSTQEVIKANAIGMTVAPNPANDHFIVSTDGETILEVSVFGINGRHVATFGNVNTDRIRIERNNLPTGQYVVRIRVAGGIAVQKLTIR